MARLATLASAIALLIAACGQATAPASSAPSASGSAPASTTSTASATSTASPAPSGDGGPSASPTARGTLTGGGPLAALVVERMARTPFRARFDVQTTSLTKTDTVSADLTATEVGTINGQDLELTFDAMSGGTHLHSRIVVVGDAVYTSERNGPWQLSTRAQMSFALDQILREIRRTVNADQLADLGEEMLDGRSVHHLTLTGPVTINDPLNGDIVFEVFDLWVLPDGSPVQRKIEVHGSKGTLTSSGSTTTRFQDFGQAIEIQPPKLPPTPAPSKRPARP